jgi:signal transduction histidine kinase
MFCILLIGMFANSVRSEMVIMTNYIGSTLAREMNSEYFLKKMGISNLRDLDPQSPAVKEWLGNLFQFANSNGSNDISSIQPVFSGQGHQDFGPEKFFKMYNPSKMVFARIIMHGQVIYDNSDTTGFRPRNDGKLDKGLQHWVEYFKIEAFYLLYNSDGETVGIIRVWNNVDYVLSIFSTIVAGIIFLGVLALIVAAVVSKFLSIPIAVPLKQLDQKLRALATEDDQTTVHSQIVLKKPLQEIETLAESTNLILRKMKEYTHRLSAQNDELEAQNDELLSSQQKIEEAQTMLVQTQQMASVGQLTAAITHEINTPLGAVNSNVQLCEMVIQSLLENDIIQNNPELRELVSQMKETNGISNMACQRVNEIIKSLKTFSKIDQAEFQEVDINDGIKSVLVLTSNLWKRKITIHEDYGQLPAVKCYSGLLNQVFMNIVVNAIQSIEDQGDIFIRTYQEDKNICASIRDNGCGIKPENLENIFKPGFTTKSKTGMGLGLSICDNIIKKHDSVIEVKSQIGQGTEFIIRLPLNR